MTVFNPATDLRVKDVVLRAGNVTQLNCLLQVTPGALEARIGYASGRLRLGWHLLLLTQSVAMGEFSWGGTTEFSDGTDPRRVEAVDGFQYRIPVQDLRRYDLWKQSGYDESAGEAAMNKFLGQHLQLLNDRDGHNRIAKVVPVIGDDGGKFWLDSYPDVSPGHGVKQWSLHKWAKKRFVVACFVPAGASYLGGGRVGIGPTG